MNIILPCFPSFYHFPSFLNFKLKMSRKRNNLSQFFANDSYSSLFIEVPGPLKNFKYFIIINTLSPLIFVRRADINSYFKKIIEFIFGFNEGEAKNINRFF